MARDQDQPETSASVREVLRSIGYMSESEFLALCGVTAVTAEGWRKRGEGPAWVRLGNAVFYPVQGVAEVLRAKTREPRRAANARAAL